MNYSLKELCEIAYWAKVHAEEGKDAFVKDECMERVCTKYRGVFGLNSQSFEGKEILDIGCGPRGTLHCFAGKRKVGLDPLVDAYVELFGIWKHDMGYVCAFAEEMPFPDNSFDVVLACNSIDHVNDLDKTVSEIWRVLRVGGSFLVSVNLQEATVTEPYSFDEAKAMRVFARFKPQIVNRLSEPHDIVVLKGTKA